ncbi:hypothetical protein HK405_011668, partial [Cladochytrium tenue]
MNEPLVDSEGFPRADVDVYAVRHARHAAARLRTDLRAVMTDIERAMHAVFAASAGSQTTAPTLSAAPSVAAAPIAETVSPPPAPLARAFAVVRGVEAGSPAAQAGLAASDRVVAFGRLSLDPAGGAAAAGSGMGSASSVLAAVARMVPTVEN